MSSAPMMKEVMQARVDLLLDHPFFGVLALRLKAIAAEVVVTAEGPAPVDTFATDGVHLFFNPTFAASLSTREMLGVVAHEVLHCSNGHQWRRGSRDQERWNMACDFAINPIVLNAGMMLPAGSLLNSAWAGKHAEHIYDLLDKETVKKIKQGSMRHRGTVGGPGGMNPGQVLDAPGNTAGHQELEWKLATIQALSTAKSQGRLPESLERLLSEMVRPRIEWKSVLRRFMQQTSKLDYSWRSPNRRFTHHGFYLPTMHSETMPPVIIGVDTSGSMGQKELDAMAAEISDILREVKPEMAYIVYCDAVVQRAEEFAPGDPFEIRHKGGGGTDFRPVFDWAKEKGIEPACLIYLTDTYGDFPDQAPNYPVLWVSTTDSESRIPWGEFLRLDLD